MSHPKAEPKDLIYRPPKPPAKPKEIEAKKGGYVRAADGCAIKGKTRGRIM